MDTRLHDTCWLVLAGLALKILLIPAYHSTDFEVHRNWLAITQSLPIDRWYYEDTSEWTLDYPPFFAWFEWVLGWGARWVDTEILNIHNLNYADIRVVIFQRATVMLSELLLAWATYRYTRSTPVFALVFLSAGLLIVDHIHFQYNGFLLGLLVWSLAELKRGRHVFGGALFAALLCFKHIYLYLAPAYFVYLLRVYCLNNVGPDSRLPGIRWINLIKLGTAVISVFIISFGPFVKHLPQMFGRLFPFKRGLCHSYWAANTWSQYAFADRLFNAVLRWIDPKRTSVPSMTRGLVGDSAFSVLPNIAPIHTFLLTMLAQIPALVNLWRKPTFDNFMIALILCGFASFQFGWHVHEKAILLIIVPFSLIAETDARAAKAFFILALTGQYALFPLIFTVEESPVKLSMLWLYTWFTYLLAKRNHVKFSTVECAYLLMLPVVHLAYMGAGLLLSPASSLEVALLKPTLDDEVSYAFLPLMMISVYCSVGISYVWLAMNVQ